MNKIFELHNKLQGWLHSGEKTTTDNQVVALVTVKFILGILVGFIIGVIYSM